jgi:RecA/RadA recombinase
MSIPYASSVRLRINSTGQQHIKDDDKNVVGIKVKATTIKNKVERPFRACEFQIHFGVGVVEHQEVFDLFRAHCSTLEECGVPCGDEFVSIEGTAAWKSFRIFDKAGKVVHEEKFHKTDFPKILYKPENQKYMDALYVDALTMNSDAMDHPTFAGINSDSIEDVEAAKAHK